MGLMFMIYFFIFMFTLAFIIFSNEIRKNDKKIWNLEIEIKTKDKTIEKQKEEIKRLTNEPNEFKKVKEIMESNNGLVKKYDLIKELIENN